LTTYKMTFFGLEGLFVSIALLIMPFINLWVLIKILKPWRAEDAELAASTPSL
jgi:hypothetical protein